MSLVIVIILVMGAVETKPRPQVKQVRIYMILAYVQNQEKGGKALKQM
jgi:hypothetical protein